MAEAKFGRLARHVQDPRLDANLRQQQKLQRTKGNPGRGIEDGFNFSKSRGSLNNNHSSSFKRGSGEEARSGGRPSKQPKKETVDVSSLHPSWAAKKRLSQAITTEFQGSKIKFDDD